MGAVRFRQSEGLVGLVVEARRPVRLTNAHQHVRFRHFQELGERVCHAFLGVPIIHYRQVLGVLTVGQMNDRVFVGQEEAFLITIAAQIADVAHAALTETSDIPVHVLERSRA